MEKHEVMSRPSVSIIVPVLNESILIRAFLERTRALAPDAEIIVVDGKSDDGTTELSADLADRLLTTSRGRARQMNAGVQAAHGQVLWFLHADSMISSDALDEIAVILRDNANVGGCFRLRLPGQKWIYRVSDSVGNLGVEIFGFALGDHGIFCRRDVFQRVGGFPDIPLLEDAELYRSLRRHGRMRQSHIEILGSQRRYEALGPYRTTIYYAIILGMYVLGFRMSALVRMYERLNRSRSATLPHHHSASVPGSGEVISRSTTLPSGLRQ